MAQHILELLRGYLASYGYWAVAVTLLLENAGLPVPGETMLLLASFLAFSEHRLQLPYIILVASGAAALGDNLGYWIGYWGGRRILAHYQHLGPLQRALVRSEVLFQRYGATTIFWARFVAGLRIVAGPLAGVLRMRWKSFVVWNFLGAVVWATAIASIGYFLGGSWATLTKFISRLDLLVVLIAAAAITLLWWNRRSVRE